MTIPKYSVFSLDDDPVFNEVLEAVLKKFGVAPQCFSKVAKFRERLRTSLPTVVLIDLHLEDGIKSYDLIKDLRKLYGPSLPILVVSGELEPKLIAHSIECGANDYILKPLNREIFASKLLSFFENEELLDVKLGLPSSTEGGVKALLSIKGKILEVDELGLRMTTPHLLTKGSTVTLKSDLFNTWAGKERKIFVTVTDTWLENRDGLYGIYCEFDSADEELTIQALTWLSKQPLA